MRICLTILCLTVAATLFGQSGEARADDAGDAISRMALRTPSGEYWSVGTTEDGTLRIFADANHVGPAEVFEATPAPHEQWRPGCLPNGARVTLTTTAGSSWFVDDRQLLIGTPPSGTEEHKVVFTLINETDAGRCFRYGDRISIISGEDYYLSASPEGIVDADQKRRGGWEVFDLVDPTDPTPRASGGQ